MTHPGLRWLEALPEGRDWLARLPALVDGAASRWGLTLGEPYHYAFASLAAPATLPDGTEAVLKVQFPDRESEHEAEALREWNGDGAVRLIDYDARRRALLIERCNPGTPLSVLQPDAALDVVIDLLPRLWKPAREPFRPLAEEAAWWLEELHQNWMRFGQPFERELFDAAVDALRELPPTQADGVLVHQDLHAANILAAERQPWLVIDPKPLAGEREFGVAAIVRGRELGHSAEAVRHRLQRLSAALRLDEHRVRRWTLAQTIAWCFGPGGPDPEHLDTARWLL